MIRLRPALWPTLISLPIFVVSLGLGIWQMERREWKRDILDRIAVNQAAAPLTLDELLQGDPLRHEYGRVKIAGSFLHDKEFYLAARSLKNNVGLQVVTPIRTDDGRIVLFDRGLVPAGEEGPGASRRGPARRHGRAHRHRAAQPGAAPVRAGQRARPQCLVPCRRAADAQHGGRRARSQARRVLPRGRRRAQPRRRAGGRPDPARHPQRPPAVRHHLVPDRRGAGRRLSRLSLGERPAHRSPAAPRSGHDRQRSLCRAGAPLCAG